MADYVEARVVYPTGGFRQMIGHPGAMWPVADSILEVEEHLMAVDGSPNFWNVCCPGCGRYVYEFRAGREAILAAVPSRRIEVDQLGRPSLDQPVDFVPCGCGTWDLTHGMWRFLKAFTNNPRD